MEEDVTERTLNYDDLIRFLDSLSSELRQKGCMDKGDYRVLRCYFRIFHTAAAKSPPIMGATQNNQSWLSAVPPTMTAGPRLLAGLTDVPSMGIPTR